MERFVLYGVNVHREPFEVADPEVEVVEESVRVVTGGLEEDLVVGTRTHVDPAVIVDEQWLAHGSHLSRV